MDFVNTLLDNVLTWDIPEESVPDAIANLMAAVDSE